MGRHNGSSNDPPKTETAHPPNRSARDRPVRNGPSSPTLSPTEAQKANVQQTYADSGIDKSSNGIPQTRSSTLAASNPKALDTQRGNNGSGWLRLVASRISALKGYIIPNPKSTSVPDERISVETAHKIEDTPHRNQVKRGKRTYGNRQGASAAPVKRALLITAENDPATGSHAEILESTSGDAKWVRACLDKAEFMPEHVKIVQGIGDAPISEEVFMDELDRLLSATGDDDVVVIFISMHSIRIQGSGEVFLVLEGKDGCPVHIGTEILVRELNSKLGNVRCTVEVILDVCYAGGLLACPHVIYEMKSASDSTIIVTTMGDEHISNDEAHPLLSQLGSQLGREPNASAACAGQPPAKSKHVIHGVASAPSAFESAPSGPSTLRTGRVRNVNAIVQGSPIGQELNTPSDIIIWAAVKKDQQTSECVSDEHCNGALTTGICGAIDAYSRPISRREILEGSVVPLFNQLNEGSGLHKSLYESDLQHPQITSNCNNKDRVLDGYIFHRLSKTTT